MSDEQEGPGSPGRLSAPREDPAPREPGQVVPPSRDMGLLVGVFLALALGILTATVLYYRSYEARFRTEVERQLSAVAELKVFELEQFRKERLGDGDLLVGNAAFSEQVATFLGPGDHSAARKVLLPWLEKLKKLYDYENVFLADPQARILLAASSAEGPLSATVTRRFPEALALSRATMVDFYRHGRDQGILLAVLAPISDPSGRGPAIGVVVLKIDPRRYLDPFLQRWPTRSRTAETLLVRRERSEVVFLNELRFRKGTALSLRIPLTATEVPAVQAALGKAGVMEGTDYRGVPVYAAIRPVPGSPWSLVAKVDVKEALSPVRERLWLVAFLAVALFLASGAGVGAVWRQQRSRFYEEQLKAAKALWEGEEERRRVAEALRESEAKYRVLFESMAEGVALHEMIYGEDGEVVDYRILDVNPAYEWLTGVVPEKARLALATELYGTGAPPYLAEYDQVVRTGKPSSFETYFPPLKRHFRISAVRQKPGQFATVFEDITTQKRQEDELKAKNAEMERFTYLVSHDLKSPLVTVKTFLGYLEEDLKTQDATRIEKDHFFLRAATDKMGRLLEDLLELSRVGRVVHSPTEVTVGELISEATEVVAGRIEERGVEIEAGPGDVVFFGDRLRLGQIWQNLLENAVKFMGDQKAPRVEFGENGRGRETVFFVRDNGIGIDPRFQEKVLGLFEKLDPGTEGTGLGLALVKRVVELYGGRIWLESEGALKGTAVLFTLPDAIRDRRKGERT
ncbi:MAG: PAS domain-containing protein [Deltaproteobacteria bacterium]|nr:PAS domain-containing protein [Deltaproteobacteria bacterium]